MFSLDDTNVTSGGGGAVGGGTITDTVETDLTQFIKTWVLTNNANPAEQVITPAGIATRLIDDSNNFELYALSDNLPDGVERLVKVKMLRVSGATHKPRIRLGRVGATSDVEWDLDTGIAGLVGARPATIVSNKVDELTIETVIRFPAHSDWTGWSLFGAVEGSAGNSQGIWDLLALDLNYNPSLVQPITSDNSGNFRIAPRYVSSPSLALPNNVVLGVNLNNILTNYPQAVLRVAFQDDISSQNDRAWGIGEIDLSTLVENYNNNPTAVHSSLNIFDNDFVRIDIVDPSTGELNIQESGRQFKFEWAEFVSYIDAQNTAQNKYQDIGNTRMQWGSSSPGVVTLPMPFKDNTYAVTESNGFNGGLRNTQITNKTTTTFTGSSYSANSSSGTVFDWIAIGEKP